MTAWPAGEPQPTVSTLNDYTGTFVANAAIVPAGTENKTAIYPSATTNLLIDTNGYFAPASSAASPLSLYTITPCRILDTRQTIGPFNGTIPIGIVGSLCGVPDVAQAFTLNATALPSGSLGFLTLWPEGLTQPGVSTLNAPDGAVTSNMAIVPAGSGNESINAFASGNNPTQLILGRGQLLRTGRQPRSAHIYPAGRNVEQRVYGAIGRHWRSSTVQLDQDQWNFAAATQSFPGRLD